MRIDRCNAGGKLKLDTMHVADGYSELRVVAVEAGPIETQGEAVVPILVANNGRAIQASASAEKVMFGAPLFITVKAPDMAAIAIYQQSQLIGSIAGDSGELPIDTAKLGEGPAVFRAVGRSSDTPPVRVLSRPIYVEIEPRK
jgi:hypothetical protein